MERGGKAVQVKTSRKKERKIEWEENDPVICKNAYLKKLCQMLRMHFNKQNNQRRNGLSE